MQCLAAAARRLLGLRSPSQEVAAFARQWHTDFVEGMEQGIREGATMEKNIDTIQITRDAYTAYGESVHWKNHEGNPMPKALEDLPGNIRDAWQAAVGKVIESVRASSPAPTVDRDRPTDRDPNAGRGNPPVI